MTKDEALKLALEALEHEADKGNDDAYKVERDAIKEALAQPEQKPVAWLTEERYAQLHTSQRTWVGLTLDEVIDMARTFGAQPWPPNSCAALGKMIEAKLKEKNT